MSHEAGGYRGTEGPTQRVSSCRPTRRDDCGPRSRDTRRADRASSRAASPTHPEAGARGTASQPCPSAEAVQAERRHPRTPTRGAAGTSVIAYVDASVLLRVALGQPDSLPEWSRIDRGVSSALVMTESLRTLDRLRLRVRLGDAEVAKRRSTILELVASLELVEIDAIVLDRASQPMPTELGTLDAIHLATALLWKELTRE